MMTMTPGLKIEVHPSEERLTRRSTGRSTALRLRAASTGRELSELGVSRAERGPTPRFGVISMSTVIKRFQELTDDLIQENACPSDDDEW